MAHESQGCSQGTEHMDQSICILIVLNDRTECATLANQLMISGMPVTVINDIRNVPTLLVKKYEPTVHQDSEKTPEQYHKYITSTVVKHIPGIHCILTTPDKHGAVLRSQHKSMKYKEMTLEEVERDHIVQTLQANEWQIQHAAKSLGIDRSTLYRKMKKYNIGSH